MVSSPKVFEASLPKQLFRELGQPVSSLRAPVSASQDPRHSRHLRVALARTSAHQEQLALAYQQIDQITETLQKVLRRGEAREVRSRAWRAHAVPGERGRE